jgi:putative ABC transport system permease protein
MMQLLNQTPLAWKNLTSQPRKLGLAAGGVGFAVLLMFMQIGFRNALFDSTVQVAKLLDADLFIISRTRNNLPSEQRFSAATLQRASGIAGVEQTVPIYIERAATELRVVGNPSRLIRVIGVPMTGHVFADEEMDLKRALLIDQRCALLDRRTKSSYGFDKSRLERLKQQDVELSGKELHIVGFVDIGTDFVHDGSIVVSDAAIRHFFPMRAGGRDDPLRVVDFGLVQLSDGAKINEVREAIRSLAPDEIDVMTKAEIVGREIRFWATATPIGIIFSVGTIMGLVVGTIICYQILYTDITDHMAEFATLKAMGYSPGYFAKLVLSQSIYLTFIGFLPGFAVTVGLYALLGSTTGLIMLLTPMRVLFVFGLTLLMCIISGLLAVRKLISADPANLF